jgi:glycosyltransferase involved in cell wall biosynthesis
MSKIPSMLFTYWVGKEFSYLHALSLRTLSRLHPHSKIIVYSDSSGTSIPKSSESLKEHSIKLNRVFDIEDEIGSLPNVEFAPLDLKSILGIEKQLFHVFCADYIRIFKLHEHGGIWFDLDILFTQNIFSVLPPKVGEGKSILLSEVRHKEEFTVGTGFIAAKPKSPMLKEMLEHIQSSVLTELDEDANYQVLGPNIWRNYCLPYIKHNLLKLHPEVQTLPLDSYAPYLWFEIDTYFNSHEISRTQKPLTFGNHWYFGSNKSREFLNCITSFESIDLDTPFGQDLRYLQKLGVDVEKGLEVPTSQTTDQELLCTHVFEISDCTRTENILLHAGTYEVYILGEKNQKTKHFSISTKNSILYAFPLPELCQETKHFMHLEKSETVAFEMSSDSVLRVVIRNISTHQEKENLKDARILTIIPLKDCEDYIQRTLNSLNLQTLKPSMVCIVDDNSSDMSLDSVNSMAVDFPLHIIQNKVSLGPYVNKNLIVSQYKDFFDYITFLDSDDYILHETYESLLKKLHTEDEALGIYPHFYRQEGVKEERFFTHPSTKLDSRRCYAGLFARTKLFEEIGFFDCVAFGADGEFDSRVRNSFGWGCMIDFEKPLYRAEKRKLSLTDEHTMPSESTKNYKKSSSELRNKYIECLESTKGFRDSVNMNFEIPEICVFESIVVQSENYTDFINLQCPRENIHSVRKKILVHIHTRTDLSMCQLSSIVSYLAQNPNKKVKVTNDAWGILHCSEF